MNFWRRNWHILVLCLIVFLGALVRLYRIGEVPYGLTYDEAGITYDAWSISTWHRDQFANFLPLSFKSFGDYKPPLLIYLLAAIFSVSGLQENMIRLVSAGAGIGSIAMIYFLSVALFEKEMGTKAKYGGLIAAIVVAFSPWSVQLSRIGFEQNLAFFLGLTGIWLLIKGVAQPRFFVISVMFLLASMYTFHTAKIFIPLALLFFTIFFYDQVKRSYKWVFFSGFIFLLFLIPFFFGNMNMRANTLILHDPVELVTNVIHQLSPAFWIMGYDATSIRHAVPGFGVLLWPSYVVLIPTLVWIVFKRRNGTTLLLVSLLIAGLLPAIASHKAPHVIRSQFALISTAIIVGYGFSHLLRLPETVKKSALWIFILITFIQFYLYAATYFGSYAISSAPEFQYGYKEAVNSINNLRQKDEMVFITTNYQQPYIYLLLYNQITPQQFLFGALNQYKIAPIHWQANTEKGLFLATPNEIPPDDKKVVTVIYVPKTQEPVLVIARN